MADEISVKDIKATQEKLQAEFEKIQADMYSARDRYNECKARLVAFNNKYGRILQIMSED